MNRLGKFPLLMSALLLGFILPSGNALAQEKPLKEQLVGTWILVSNANVAADGKLRQLFGSHPKGIAIFTANGWYAQLEIDPDRPKFKGKTRLDGTAAENKAVVRATAVHFGTWSVNEADKTLFRASRGQYFPE